MTLLPRRPLARSGPAPACGPGLRLRPAPSRCEAPDDIAALTRTVNDMLGRPESAFLTQRQFVDDAGHELRTPITIVRGHLELMGNDPAERWPAVRLVAAGGRSARST